MLPRGVECDHHEPLGLGPPEEIGGSELRQGEGGVGGGGGGGRREEVDGGREPIEERGEPRAELAVEEDGGVEEAPGEDGDGGELVAGLVRVLEDHDPRSGRDRRAGDDVAEAYPGGAVASGAHAAALRRRCVGGEADGGFRFWWVHARARAGSDSGEGCVLGSGLYGSCFSCWTLHAFLSSDRVRSTDRIPPRDHGLVLDFKACTISFVFKLRK